MRFLNIDGKSSIHLSFAHAIKEWTNIAPENVIDSKDPAIVNAYYNSRMENFGGKIHIEFGEYYDDLTFSYDFNSPEEEAFFILKWS